MSVQRTTHLTTALLPLLFCITLTVFLSGCENNRTLNTSDDNIINQDAAIPPSEQEAIRLKQCQQELGALKSINPEKHKMLSGSFDHLMIGAAQYAALRHSINSQTQDTVDSLYRYKVNHLCADITQATLSSLASQAENNK
ncbi:hypothetical protein [Serratia marcescens]|uniref:hypothetical protein n=1 Tax=Serratia marcescens TaxID=615 RepID=UPI0039891EAC